MVVGLFNDSFYNFIDVLPPVLTENVGLILAIFKAIGVLAAIYLIYLIIMLTINLRKIKQLGKIRRRIEVMDSKIDLLIQKRGIKIPKKLKIEEPIETFWDKILKRYER